MVTSALLGLVLVSSPVADDFGKLWEQCAQSIRGQYWARKTRGPEMEALLKKYTDRAKGAKSRAEFSAAVNAMIDEFNDSHFEFLSDDRQGYYLFDGLARKEAARMPHIGAWFKPASDGYTVTMVLDGFEAERAGLRKGDVIVSIDGEEFTPVTSLKPRVDKEATLKVRRGSQTLDAKVEVGSKPAMELFLEATRNSARVIEDDGKKIGYVHLWTQANERFVSALHGIVYGKLRDTDAMILDLRDGFGGRPEAYADPFFRPDVKLEWNFGERTTMRQDFGYGRPLVVLVNKGSRSAKEVLSYILKKSGRATLVGTTTAGDVLGTGPFRVADWAYLEIPMVDLKVDGERIERAGVAPHVPVPQEHDAEGNDLHLAKALEVLRGKLK